MIGGNKVIKLSFFVRLLFLYLFYTSLISKTTTKSFLQFYCFYFNPMSYSRKVPYATMDSYSRNSKYTQTFFHHPTRNKHTQLQYEMRNSNRQIKTFQPKKKSQCQSLMYESALNPFVHHNSHHQVQPSAAGDRKKVVYPQSTKATDPITLSYEKYQPYNKFTRPFQATLDYARDIERKCELPIRRQFSKSTRHYHSQIGFSPSSRDRVITKPSLNNSTSMKATLQYEGSGMKKATCFDDFRYNSRK